MAETKISHPFKGLTIKIQLKRRGPVSRSTEDQTKNIKVKQ
jgi:hypothetical protein